MVDGLLYVQKSQCSALEASLAAALLNRDELKLHSSELECSQDKVPIFVHNWFYLVPVSISNVELWRVR